MHKCSLELLILQTPARNRDLPSSVVVFICSRAFLRAVLKRGWDVWRRRSESEMGTSEECLPSAFIASA